MSDKEKKAREILEAATPHAAATLAKAAMDGDVKAAMAVLERVLGKARSASEDLDALRESGPLTTREKALAALEALTRQAG